MSGLAIVAVLATAALASEASAAEFVARPSNAEEEFPLPLMGEGGAQRFTTASGTITCERGAWEGQYLKESNPSLAFPVTFSGKCTANGLANVAEPISTTLRIHADGTVDVLEPIAFKVEATLLTEECVMTIPAQEGLGGIAYDANYNPVAGEEEAGVLGVLANVSGILSEGDGGPCGEGESEDHYEGASALLLTDGGTLAVE